ncbi:hypothetical protein Sango_1235900 [Sesamum angolense]|uniref:Uncharacterized protein n=1 Tax=Sesamum angolense TaxID=2727404 RepID=A0AAE1WQU1_9LAMI|nr:hypothetical protein Sango_1235900 [Sesamum angolense]
MVIPGPSNPKCLIDMYLEPLIKELLQLWHIGVQTYDNATDHAFIMPVVLIWTVNDLPSYGMGEGTHGHKHDQTDNEEDEDDEDSFEDYETYDYEAS